jgi:hypothetical protein
MPDLRFATVRDLYEAFPTAEEDVGLPPSDEASLPFLQSLVKQESWSAAVSFCAYLLPRREAVWWGCQSVRRLQPQRSPKEAAALDLAEAWVHEPEENRRRQALALGMQGDNRSPTTWMLLGVGWSGGSVMPQQNMMVPPAPQQTALAVRAGVLIALAWIPKPDAAKLAKPCLEDGIKLAVGES